MLKNSFRICPRINTAGRPPPTWTSPLNRRLAPISIVLPVRFSPLASSALDLFELSQQPTFVIDLMDMSRCKIHQRLMRPLVVISLDIPANLFSGRDLVGIIAHQINLLLLDRPIKLLGQRIVGGPYYPSKGQSSTSTTVRPCSRCPSTDKEA